MKDPKHKIISLDFVGIYITTQPVDSLDLFVHDIIETCPFVACSVPDSMVVLFCIKKKRKKKMRKMKTERWTYEPKSIITNSFCSDGALWIGVIGFFERSLIVPYTQSKVLIMNARCFKRYNLKIHTLNDERMKMN